MNKRVPPEAKLLIGSPHECPYLPERAARMMFLHPGIPVSARLEQSLLDLGFRRTGPYLYRPSCTRCRACVPLRIPVGEFRPSRSQRRCWKANISVLSVDVRPPVLSSEHHDLYRRYMAARHNDSPMAEATTDSCNEFFFSRWSNTLILEMRLDGELVGAAVTDRLEHGLSAVYTFFSPEPGSLGLGTYSILWQIEWARRLGLRWIYLGYWIEDCKKMRYKSGFRPTEAWSGSEWVRFAPGEAIELGTISVR